MTARSFLITYNNPEEDTYEFLSEMFNKLKAVYVNGQLERGANGTLHIQSYINFSSPVRPSKIKKFRNKLHIEAVKVENGADRYCLKEDTRVEGPWEFGHKPIRVNNKTDWESVYQSAIDNRMEDIPKSILIRHYGNLQKIAKDHIILHPTADKVRGTWIWGPTGSGKSTLARQLAEVLGEKFYPKMCNKWWDGYQGQKVIILEDIGSEHNVLGHHLKIWADKYSFIGECKGGAVAPDYQEIIVTSNYSIEQMGFKEQDLPALIRRFKIINLRPLLKEE